ncbi:MAG: hypothetical protein BWY31_02063 [Lentisphaerae bacterium ADurb.Bin242]|nr:MAG: hypothetical protein BWY31_02063 [Lentisphaerae bacterium ADurb.Bin242]
MKYKFFAVLPLFLAAAAAYAQKPVLAAVTDIEDDPSNGLEMCRSLFNEYYLSELTTHTKVNMLDTATTQKATAKLQLKRGADLAPDEVKRLCKELGIDALCLVKMSRKEKNTITTTIEIVSREGKPVGTVSAKMEGVGDTDAVSSKLAAESAKILRKYKGIEESAGQLDSFRLEPLPNTVTEIK